MNYGEPKLVLQNRVLHTNLGVRVNLLTRILLIVAVIISLLTLAGCGGASDAALANLSGVPLAVDVAWPARTKSISPTGSALSMTINLVGAKSDGSDFNWEIDRDGDLTAHTVHYTSTDKVLPGNYSYTVTFFTAAGGSGSIVGVANGSATIDNTGAGLTTVTVQTTIASVLIPSGQGVTQGSTSQLVFTATDLNGNMVAVSPGSATWSIQVGANVVSLTPAGVLGYLQAGSATVLANVDGVVSIPNTVTSNASVGGNPGIIVTISPKQQTLSVLGHIQFGATVTNDTGNKSVSWTTVDVNGVLTHDGSTISPNGYYTPSATPGTYYVRATSNADTSKFDTATITVINQ